MTNKYEIQVQFNGSWFLLDTYEYDPISLQYQITDINEIDKRRSSYSKTIKLPMTKINRKILSDITNPAVVSDINPNKKAVCYVLVNTIPVFQGTLQIANSSYQDFKNLEEIEVVVYSDNDDFYKSMAEKYLTELDLSYMTHTYSTTNVVDSWNQTADTLPYFYPLIDYGNDWSRSSIGWPLGTGIKTTDLYPAPYVKAIWDLIFSETGFTYQSNFLNSDTFKNLIIPFTKEKAYSIISNIENYLFYVGLQPDNTLSVTQNGDAGREIDEIYPWNYESSPYYDPGNVFNSTTHIYTHPDASKFSQRFRAYLKFNIPKAVVDDVENFFEIPTIRAQIKRASGGDWFPLKIAGSADPQVLNPSTAPFPVDTTYDTSGAYAKYIWEAWVTTDWLDGSLGADNGPLFPGDQVRFMLDFKMLAAYNGAAITFMSGSYLFNEINDALKQNMLIDMNRILPDNIKQKDFINSIIKMFNLYIEPNINNPKSLIIEPRDDYYSSGAIEDWTDKLDLDQPIEEEILSNTQFRTILGTYKPDTDYFNQAYTQNTNKIYGQYKEELDNDFINDERKIEITFSPSPLANITGMDNFPIVKIGKLDNDVFKKTSANIRILTRSKDGLLDLSTGADSFKFQGNKYTSYPYAGHLDDPYNPDYDINFGLVDGLFGFNSDLTSDTLIEKYWRKQFDEYNDKDSKLVTCNLILEPSDIYNFRFNKKIFLDIKGNGQYYRVLAIEEYDPGIRKTSKVKLLKVKDITVPLKRKSKRYSIGDATSFTSLTAGSFKTALARNNILIGDYSTITSEKNLLLGDNSSVQGVRSILIGDNSYINGVNTKSAIVMGSDNTIGVSSSYINILGASNSVPDNADTFLLSGSNNNFISGLTGASYSRADIKAVSILGDNNNIDFITPFAGSTLSNVFDLKYVNVFGEGNKIGLSSSYVNVFGENNTINPGLTNVQVYGDNQTVTKSNTIIYSPSIELSVKNIIVPDDTITIRSYSSTSSKESRILLNQSAPNLQLYVSGTTTGTQVLIGNYYYTINMPYITTYVQSYEINTTGVGPTNYPLILPSNETISVKVRVIADDGIDHYYGELSAVYTNPTGTPVLIGTVNLVETKTFATATTNLIITGTDLRLSITGQAATLIKWRWEYEYFTNP